MDKNKMRKLKENKNHSKNKIDQAQNILKNNLEKRFASHNHYYKSVKI